MTKMLASVMVESLTAASSKTRTKSDSIFCPCSIMLRRLAVWNAAAIFVVVVVVFFVWLNNCSCFFVFFPLPDRWWIQSGAGERISLPSARLWLWIGRMDDETPISQKARFVWWMLRYGVKELERHYMWRSKIVNSVSRSATNESSQFNVN